MKKVILSSIGFMFVMMLGVGCATYPNGRDPAGIEEGCDHSISEYKDYCGARDKTNLRGMHRDFGKIGRD